MTTERFMVDDAGTLIDMQTREMYDIVEEICPVLNALHEENQALRKEIHLVHMSAMFSTVKSFKGDVSKRYRYKEETDTIYDTANNYGQYDKVLDNKEITMLLNEYNTLLGEKND